MLAPQDHPASMGVYGANGDASQLNTLAFSKRQNKLSWLHVELLMSDYAAVCLKL